MKDTEYRPEPLENPDIAQEDIPETPAEAEAMPVVLPDLSESRPVVTGELMEGPEAVPEDPFLLYGHSYLSQVCYTAKPL